MNRFGFQHKLRLYKRAYSYISSSTPLIVGALLISVVMGFTQGLATYSFLPIFSIVFTTSQLPVGESPTPSAVSSASLVSPTAHWQQTLTQTVHRWFISIAGRGDIQSQLLRLVASIIGLSIITSILFFLVDFLFIKIQAHGTERLRQDTFDHLTILPLSFYTRVKSGEVIARVENDIGGTISMVTKSIADIIQHTFLAIIFLGLLFLIESRLVLVMLPLLGVVGIVVAIIGRWVKYNRERILRLQGDLVSIIQELLSGIRVIKGFSAEKVERDKWHRSTGYWRYLEVINNLNKALPLRLNEIIAVVVAGLVLIFGGNYIVQGSLSGSELLLFFLVLIRFQTPIGVLSRLWLDIQNGMAYAERAFGLLDEPGEHYRHGRATVSQFKGIRFSNVHFNYGQEPVIRNVSFEIRSGTTVALVGPSGSGKSSLADLLIRFYEPTKGTITMDDRSVQEFNLESYRQLFALVTQDTFLFHDTVWNNIVYGAGRQVSEEEGRAAAAAAYVDEFIQALPQGYQTVIGDRGVRLSGGQRQRVAIARALLKNPAILILDEATSALDTESERQVQAAIATLVQHRTTLVIAHRLSTIIAANHIVVLHEGAITEQGSHRELLAHDGLYRHLWDLQSGGYVE